MSNGRARLRPSRGDDTIDGLPAGWDCTSLATLGERIRGVSYSRGDASTAASTKLVAILRANNITESGLVFDDLVYVPPSKVSDAQHVQLGDIVIAMSSGSKAVVGKAAQLNETWTGAFGAFCGVLRPSPEIEAKYLGYFLKTQEYRTAISDMAAGTNINNLKAEHFEQIIVPIPPLAEQQRIVAALDAVLAKVASCRERLARIPSLLKRFRQAVLAAACSGRLTADWRDVDGPTGGIRGAISHLAGQQQPFPTSAKPS